MSLNPWRLWEPVICLINCDNLIMVGLSQTWSTQAISSPGYQGGKKKSMKVLLPWAQSSSAWGDAWEWFSHPGRNTVLGLNRELFFFFFFLWFCSIDYAPVLHTAEWIQDSGLKEKAPFVSALVNEACSAAFTHTGGEKVPRASIHPSAEFSPLQARPNYNRYR